MIKVMPDYNSLCRGKTEAICSFVIASSLGLIHVGIKTCEVFLCFVGIVRVRSIMLTSLFSLFYVAGAGVSQVFTPRMSRSLFPPYRMRIKTLLLFQRGFSS